MKGVTHAFIGTAASVMAAKTFHIDYGLSSAFVAVIGSLLPDIDENHSTINRYIPLKKVFFAGAALYLAYLSYLKENYLLIIPAAIALMIYLSKHRGFTHSILASIIFSFPLARQGELFIPFLTGYVLHPIADMFNTKGVLLLYPLQKRFTFATKIKMDSTFGHILETLLIVLSILTISQNLTQ